MFLCCLVVTEMLFGSGHYPESGTDPDCDSCPATSGDPVVLVRGSVKETVTDLSISGSLGGWHHTRDYDSMLDTRTYNNPNYNIQG
ncbi:MAG: hypothetical protein LBJ00_11160, partial [Planctomycetaceae bacterium]|nr:hypothetical protein [Planctomycetaceae bacterium]